MNSEDSRNIILAIVLSVLVLIGWNYFYAAPQLQKDRLAHPPAQTQSQTNGAAPSAGGAGALAPPAPRRPKPRLRPSPRRSRRPRASPSTRRAWAVRSTCRAASSTISS